MTPRAFADSQLKHVSASQITTYSRCARKWFYEKIIGLKQPATAATELGENIHKQMEDYYLNGIIPSYPSARIFLQDEPRLPPRDADLLIEFPKDYRLDLTAAAVPVKGRIDLLWAHDELRLTILDWKSASSFNYTKTPEELAQSNAQLTIYSKWAFQRFPTLEQITVGHGYIRTDTKKPPAGRLVLSDPMDRPHVDTRFEVVEAVVEQMKDCATATDPELVPGNPQACGDFKGCPYREQCSIGRASSRRLVPYSPPSMEPRMTLKERFAARAAANSEVLTTPPVSSPAANQDVEPVGTLQAYEAVPGEGWKRNPSLDVVVGAVGINPPDAAPVVSPYDELRTRIEALEARVNELLGRTG